jgi:hypothetical protein
LSGLSNDVEDIQTVAEYMEKTYGYYIHMIIGHSRGSLVGCKWLASGTPQTASAELFVNISGRYRMEVSK